MRKSTAGKINTAALVVGIIVVGSVLSVLLDVSKQAFIADIVRYATGLAVGWVLASR